MPLYYFRCLTCGSANRRILEPSQVKKTLCNKCNGKLLRTPKPPTAMLKEMVDTGLMPKRLENYVDGHSLTKKRSTLDLSKPDWQIQNE